MDWGHELAASSIWLAEAFFFTLIGFVAIAYGLARTTVWGRQFWRLTWPYFSPSRSWKPLGAIALILFLTLFGVRMNVLFSFWYNGMYSALQKLDAKMFWFFMALFSILASVHVARSLLEYYIQQAFTLKWRIWLNDNLVDRWLEKQAYYRTQHLAQPADNPDQRIQQDITSFVASSLSLSMGVVDAIVSTIEFTVILWGLSAALPILGVTIPRGMVFLVYAYVLIATVFAFKIGRPLIRLNFLNEQLSANYRYGLMRLREYGESVAFFRGERVERGILEQRFLAIIGNAWAIIYRSLKFLGFNFIISQTAAVFPFIIQASRFFSKQITLGDMVQTAQSFGQLQGNLSFFRQAYDDFATYRAVLNRLTGFVDAIEQADALPTPTLTANGKQVILDGFSVSRPDAVPLVSNLTLDITPNKPLLVRGRSGVGKTTLLRAVAGLWPYAQGGVTRPDGGRALFLSQRPYLPLGTLRTALYYPAPADTSNAAAAEEVLRACHLEHLIPRLDEDADWSRILSLGEQQRLSFGRALLAKPDAVFLDEATSAMDEELEGAMYKLLRERLPETVVVSVGHRSTLKAFHGQELVLQGGGHWDVEPIPA